MAPKAKAKPTRAVCYVRISINRDDETSTETQEQRIRAYCDSQGWTVVEVVTEPGRSAYKASRNARPGLTKAKGLIAAGAADVLVCWKLDRIARNTVDTLNLVEELAGHGAQLVSVTEHFDSSTPSGEMTLTVLAALARVESATKSERVQAWQDHRRANGATPTGPRPYGYQRAGRNKLLIDKDEAAQIRKAAKRVLAGDSLRSITADMTAAGVVGTNGMPIKRATLRQLLVSPTIAACREAAPGVFVDCQSDDWKPILGRKTWDAVYALLTDPSRRNGPGNRRRWLFSGIAACGRCEDATKMGVQGHTGGPRYTCPVCHLSIEVKRTDDGVEGDLLALLDAKAWRRLRQGQPTSSADTGFEDAMNELTARFVAGDIDGTELAAVADELRRQQEIASTPPVSLPDVADLGKAWPTLTLEQRRTVVLAVTESLIIKPSVGGKGFDEKRIVWTPVE
jgi:site-specific DNA recombinase